MMYILYALLCIARQDGATPLCYPVPLDNHLPRNVCFTQGENITDAWWESLGDDRGRSELVAYFCWPSVAGRSEVKGGGKQ